MLRRGLRLPRAPPSAQRRRLCTWQAARASCSWLPCLSTRPSPKQCMRAVAPLMAAARPTAQCRIRLLLSVVLFRLHQVRPRLTLQGIPLTWRFLSCRSRWHRPMSMPTRPPHLLMLMRRARRLCRPLAPPSQAFAAPLQLACLSRWQARRQCLLPHHQSPMPRNTAQAAVAAPRRLRQARSCCWRLRRSRFRAPMRRWLTRWPQQQASAFPRRCSSPRSSGRGARRKRCWKSCAPPPASGPSSRCWTAWWRRRITPWVPTGSARGWQTRRGASSGALRQAMCAAGASA